MRHAHVLVVMAGPLDLVSVSLDNTQVGLWFGLEKMSAASFPSMVTLASKGTDLRRLFFGRLAIRVAEPLSFIRSFWGILRIRQLNL